MQNLTIVSFRERIIMNKFKKNSSQVTWIVYSVRPVYQS